MKNTKGILLTIISAVIFGFTPILAKYTILGGSNATMLTFCRMFLALPFIFIILKVKKVSLKITKQELKQIVIMCCFGSGITTLTLYASYKYIAVGVATTIHFIYPALVSLACILFFKEKASKAKIIAIILSNIGVWMFFEGDMVSGSMIGILLAALSGVTYAFYMIFMDRSGLSQMFAFKLSFYICAVNSIIMLIYGLITHEIVFSLPAYVWGLNVLISILTSIFAISFLQLGIKYIGPSNAAIFSLFEPITSVVLGIVLLNERCSFKTVLGCILIVIAVGILSAPQKNKTAIGK